MQKSEVKLTDMVLKVAELMALFQKYDRTEEVIIKTLYGLLDLINILEDIETTHYLHNSTKIKVIPSKKRPTSKALNENALEIKTIWTEMKKENEELDFITFSDLVSKSERLSQVSFDNIDIKKSVITEAAGRSGEYDLFIIEKKSIDKLSEYEREYIKKLSQTARIINEKVHSGAMHRENEKILTQVLDNIDSLIYVSDLETEEVLFVNNSMKKVFKLNDIKGQVCWKIFQQNFTQTCDFCPVRKLKSIEDEPIIWEEHNTVTNQYYQNTDRLISWIDGRIVHIQNSVDITPIKNAEKELKVARDIAQKNAQAKSEFLSKMSHELRTPLNAILGMINIIEKSNDLQKINDFVKKMKSASDNLLQTINDILDISKIDAGKMEIFEEEFKIEEMFRSIFDIVEYVAHEKDITLDANIENNPNYFIGDAKRISQVYMNLLSNAIKFTEKGGKITISVKYNKLFDGYVEVVSKVTDTGVGIPADKIDTLFESFIQVDNRLSRQYSGTGLGLVIAKTIVELMGGAIIVDSELGKGTTFSFNLKIKESDKEQQIEVLPETFNILIIDDNEEVCDYLSNLFNARKIKHTVVASSNQGISLIEETNENFNVILVDYGIDGLETIKKLKAVVDSKTIIIMVSSMDLTNIEEEARKLGVRHFLPKPLLPSDIINAINEIYKEKEIKHVETEEEKYDFNGKTILLFEDVDINREIVHLLLEDTKIIVENAEDGIVGIEKYNKTPEKYDLILMDIQMPNMDGFEATKLIRESGNSNAQTIPIIAMTANVFAEQIQDTLEAGMNAHLGKPVSEAELKRELNKWLNQ